MRFDTYMIAVAFPEFCRRFLSRWCCFSLLPPIWWARLSCSADSPRGSRCRDDSSFLPFGAALNSDPEFTNTLQHEMRPIINLFTPIFFAMVGLSLDFSAVDWTSMFFWLFSITILVGAILGKLIGGWCSGGGPYLGTAIGMAMVPRGEVGLIVAELGRTSGIFDVQVYASMVIVVAYTTLLSPFFMKMYYRRYAAKLADD